MWLGVGCILEQDQDRRFWAGWSILVLNCAKQNSLRAVHKVLKPAQSKKQRQCRMRWATRRIGMVVADCSKIISSDETQILQITPEILDEWWCHSDHYHRIRSSSSSTAPTNRAIRPGSLEVMSYVGSAIKLQEIVEDFNAQSLHYPAGSVSPIDQLIAICPRFAVALWFGVST